MIGVGLSIVQLAVRQMLGSAFTPASLFASSEPGVWYDPSDLSTLFQDSAGTTPVTAVEQPVGLMLDKSKGLVLGPELRGTGALITFGTVTTGSYSDSSGVGVVNRGATVNDQSFVRITGLTANTTYRVYLETLIGAGLAFRPGNHIALPSGVLTTSGSSILVGMGAATEISITTNGNNTSTSFTGLSVRELPGNHAYQTTSTSRPVLSARVNLLTNTETLSTQSVTTQATDYKLRFTGTGTITLSGTKTGVYTAGTHTLTGVTAGTLTVTVAGSVTQADIRPANLSASLPAYQRVNTATDYDAVGFPSGETFDGSDDYQTASSGGGSTSAFFWCSAIMVRKVGSTQTLFSDTGTNTGYRVRINASNQLELSAGNGSAYTTVATTATLAYGQIAVLTAWHDGTNLNVQIDNGTVHQMAFATASAGTASLTIGRDNGAASSYAGIRLFEKVYLKDLVPSAEDIAKTKTYVGATAGMTI